MNLAIVNPYPIGSRALGGAVRVLALARHLADRHDVIVLTHGSGDAEADARAIADLAEFGVRQETFERPVVPRLRRLRWALDSEPYFVHFNRSPALEARLTDLERNEGLDAVHVEFTYLAPLLAGLGPEVVRSVAEQELMSLVLERLRRVPARHKRPYDHYIVMELPRVRRFEERVLAGFDLVRSITPLESDRMAEALGAPVGVLPHIVDTRVFVPPDVEPVDPVMMYVGNFAHNPNLAAIHWFADHVWPAVRAQVPGARADIVGPHLPKSDQRDLAAAGLTLMGRVEDLVQQYGETAVFVNPILSGGGMRGKVLEAFACGRPVVSTPRGMEGMQAVGGEHYVEAGDADGFVRAVVDLLRDAPRRHAMGKAGRALVENRYDTRVVFSRFEQDLEDAVARKRDLSRRVEARVAGALADGVVE